MRTTETSEYNIFPFEVKHEGDLTEGSTNVNAFKKLLEMSGAFENA